MSTRHITRRMFLAGSAAAVVTGCATAAKKGKAPGKISVKSPNEKLNIAGIGANGKGMSDITGCGSENIVAVCDADLDRTKEILQRFPNAKVYQDFRVMLDKQKDIEACTVSTPDHFHAQAAYRAMKLGKHVYVQKPLTHTVYEARLLQKTAREMKVATQMGNQGHSGNGVRQLCEMVWSGALGTVKEVHVWTNRPIWPQGLNRPDKVDPVPANFAWDIWLAGAQERPFCDVHPVSKQKCYHPFVWRGWWDFGCGALGDMACHIMDPPNWAMKLGAPTSVEVLSCDGMTSEQGPVSSTLKYEFPKRGDMAALTLYWYDGSKKDAAGKDIPNMPKRPDGVPANEKLGDGDCGSLFIGDKGIATANTYGEKPRLIPASRMADYKMPNETLPRIPHQDHYGDWIQACKGGKPACSNFDYAAPFSETVLLGNIALRTGKKIEWDSANMKVTNLPDANQYVHTQYRKGWEL